MNSASLRSAGACSSSGRTAGGRSGVRFLPATPRNSGCVARRCSAILAAAAGDASVALDPKDAARMDAIAQGIEARLQAVYDAAPDDQSLEDLQDKAAGWSEQELYEEGKRAGAADKRKVKPEPIVDPNMDRARKGLRRIVNEVPVEALPKVAVVGRPNVGKSALFNRMIGRTAAIVYDTPGVTRDRLYHRANWGGREYVLIDTGGLMASAAKLPAAIAEAAMAEVSAENLPFAIERQAAAGVAEADVIVFVCDGQEGPTAADDEVVMWLRRQHSDKKVILAVNKCESSTQGDLLAANFWELGLEPLAVSAISGSGTGEMMERVIQALPPAQAVAQRARETPLAVAIIGRPNVGKSSLVNAITGTNRAIVSDLSGTTHDAVDSEIVLPDGTPVTLVDTAGIRRRTKVASSPDGAEPMSVKRAIRAMRRTDVVALMLDAEAGVTVQDYRIAELASEQGCGVVLVLNKWDLADDTSAEAMKRAEERVKAELRPVSWAKVVFTSATEGKNVHKVLKACVDSAEKHAQRVTTATLNLVVSEATAWKAPPSLRGSTKQPKLYYATQAAVRPPTFIMFCNDGKLIGDDYRRYLERALRESIDLEGTPVRMYFRGRNSGASASSGQRQRAPVVA